MKIEGCQHIGIYCRDLGESLAFYRDKLGFKHLFSFDAASGGSPQRMAWVKGWGIVIELIEKADKTTCEAAAACRNHIALRVDDVDAFADGLRAAGVEIEVGPLDTSLAFDRPLDPDDHGTFAVCGPGGTKMRILFFRGPAGERFEAVQDNIRAL